MSNVIDFTAHIEARLGSGTTARHQAAAASDCTAHPLVAAFHLPATATGAEVREILSRASAEGRTTAQAARELRELGIDSKAAKMLARTGLAVIADRTR